MKKKITIIVETEEDNEKIERHVEDWVKDNFQKNEKAEIKIEDEKEEKNI